MRIKKSNDGLTVRAIAGTHVVFLGFDLPKSKCKGLLGFAVHREDHTEDEAYWLEGMKVFKSVPRDAPIGARFSTREHPIQDFSWSDFSAKPGHEYTYTVHALYGEPAAPESRRSTAVKVETESEEGGTHDIYFNRGAAASQEYARRFQNQRPDDAGDEAWRWLSRGLHEALIGFIERAKGKKWGLRVCAYEFTETSVLKALRAAVDRKVDVRVIYHAREGVDVDKKGKSTQTGRNRKAVKAAHLEDVSTERKVTPKGDISHNKFIVLLEGEKPIAVLTGSTNFSTGGIFGHSNVVHVVEEEDVAAAFLAYWERLLADPHKSDLGGAHTAALSMPAALPAKGTTGVFSPRETIDALECYCRLGTAAKDAVFVTLAFGMHALVHDIFGKGKCPLCFGLMERMALASKDKAKEKAEIAKVIALRKMARNRIGVGAFLPSNKFDEWLEEKLTGLNTHVRFLHTKYMLLDPLGDDPIVVTGSANFSKASCTDNDENMLVIRGNKRVADIYFGEFMRLYRHYSFRDFVGSGAAEKLQATPQFLDEKDKWWKSHFGATPKSAFREYTTA